jgi:hypothetical protein
MTTIVRQGIRFLPFNDGDLSAFQADFGQVLLAVFQKTIFITAVAEIVVNATKASLQAFIPRGILGQDAAEFDFSVVHFVFHYAYSLPDSQKIARIIFNFSA